MHISIPLNIEPFKIRAMRFSDINALHTLYHHPTIAPWLPESFTSGSILSTAWLLKELLSQSQYPNGLMLAIVNEHDTMIGTCALEAFVREHGRYEIAFELHPDYHNRGIMHSALKELTRIAFDDFKAHRLDAYTLTHNTASHNTLRKAGFTLEGTLKQFRHFRHAYHDIMIFGLVRDDRMND